MDHSVKVEEGRLICCKENHNEPIVMVAFDSGIPISEMMLCLKCFSNKRQVSKYLSVEEAQALIEERLIKLAHEQDKMKTVILKDLNEFVNKMINIKSRIMQQIDEVLRISELWISDIKNIGKKSRVDDFIENLQLLQQEEKVDQDQVNKINKSNFNKINMIIQKLMSQDYYQNCQKMLQNILSFKIERQPIKNKQFFQMLKKSNVKQDNIYIGLIDTVQQIEPSSAIAFNISGSIMVAGCGKDIKVWSFEKGRMIEKKRLQGHTNGVTSLVFSKKHNWFASGSWDETIRCWKVDDKLDWISTQPQTHPPYVHCLILNNTEDQIISCSYDQTIKVWKVNQQYHSLDYFYTLENRHTNSVYSISFNESETFLISCGYDKKIILWSNENNTRWKFVHELIMDDCGYRICFLNETQIFWQQYNQGITHVLEIQQKKLVQRTELNLTLNHENNDNFLFPTIINKNKQVIIQKHNRFVYVLKLNEYGELSIVSEQIDCRTCANYGNLTEDGQYLVIWNSETKEFKIYKILYE